MCFLLQPPLVSITLKVSSKCFYVPGYLHPKRLHTGSGGSFGLLCFNKWRPRQDLVLLYLFSSCILL